MRFQNDTNAVNPYNRADLTKKQYLRLQIPTSSLKEEDFSDSFLDGFSDRAWDMVGYYSTLQASFSFIAPSQRHTGTKIGVTDRQVRRYLVEFEKLGLISSSLRWNNSKLYKLNPIFFQSKVREALAKRSKFFRFLPVLLLSSVSALAAHVRLGLSNIYINKPLEYVSHIEGDPNGGLDMGPVEISDTLKSITCIRLTRWGQIRLACYPDEALLAAQEQFKNHKGKIGDPFAWFKTACERHCYERSLRIKHEKVTSLRERFPEPTSARMLLDAVQPATDFAAALDSVKQDPKRSWLLGDSPLGPSTTQPPVDLYDDDVARRIAERKRAWGIKSL